MSALPKSIYKYPLQPSPSAGVQVVEMPTHARILDCKMVGDSLFMWALVDTTEPVVKRAFVVHPTGAALPMAPGRHVATVVEAVAQGATAGDTFWQALVWHVFEVPA